MKVAIIGGRIRTGEATSYDKTWEIWGLNAIRPRWIKRWHRMFNLHRFAHLERDCPEYIDADATWSRRNPKVPFYVVDSWKGWLANQILFPQKELAKMPRGNYHAGSFDWMVAFAIHLKAEIISLHGIGLNLESNEPISARACLEYWCGYAQGRGIAVWIDHHSDPFHQYHIVKSDSVYGYDDVRLVEDRT